MHYFHKCKECTTWVGEVGGGGELCSLDPGEKKGTQSKEKWNGGKESGDDKKMRARKRVLLTYLY